MMIWNLFKIGKRSCLGIDIGTFAIKIVEISQKGKTNILENYGELQSQELLYESPFRDFTSNGLKLTQERTAQGISLILKEARIKTKKAFFSLPDFSSFFTTIELPPMTEEEVPEAVKYSARQHIPLPLSEVTLDWEIIEKGEPPDSSRPYKVLLVAVPNEIIHQYERIAQKAGLKILGIEAEVFAFSRAVVENDPRNKKLTVVLVDIGARSTTVSVVDKSILKLSHSFDISGSDLTNVIAKGFNINQKTAEEWKIKYGLLPSQLEIRKTLSPLIDVIVDEIQRIIQNFYQTEQKRVNKIIIAGGSAHLPGLREYLKEKLSLPIEIASPFQFFQYPPILKSTLEKMGPSYAIAVGVALRGFKK